jgi:hypothetical protein
MIVVCNTRFFIPSTVAARMKYLVLLRLFTQPWALDVKGSDALQTMSNSLP